MKLGLRRAEPEELESLEGPDLDEFLSEVDAEERAERKAARSGKFGDLLGQGSKSARKGKAGRKSQPGRALPRFAKRDKSVSDVHQWTNGSNLAAKAGTVGIVVAIVAGPAAFVMQMTHKQTAQTSQAGAFDTRMMNRRDAADDVATQFVTTWLTSSDGQQNRLSAYWPSADTSSVVLPAKASTVGQTDVVRSEPVGPGVWSVTVSADVSSDGSSPRHRYFRIPISVAGESTVAAQALSLPAEVPGPAHQVAGISLSYPATVTPSDAASTMTSQFLTALLTGQSNIGLLESPGTSIPPVANSPWKNVRLVELKAADASVLSQVKTDGTTLHVQASVALSPQTPKNGSIDSSSETSAQYQLTLTSRAGRWEISSLDTTPQLSTPTPKRVSAK